MMASKSFREKDGSDLRPNFTLSVRKGIGHKPILGPISVRIWMGHVTEYTRVLSKRRTTRSTSTVDETRAASRVESTGASILSGASSTSVHGGEITNSQRDHNRATFIINIGGSDSDASSSALVVSNPTTSSSVGDSPRARSSSSVRDLPYSSTRSASSQEQSSLEEFSASTDSGLGVSEVSSEIESSNSPSDEEENVVEKEPNNVIYERHMYLQDRKSVV